MIKDEVSLIIRHPLPTYRRKNNSARSFVGQSPPPSLPPSLFPFLRLSTEELSLPVRRLIASVFLPSFSFLPGHGVYEIFAGVRAQFHTGQEHSVRLTLKCKPPWAPLDP